MPSNKTYNKEFKKTIVELHKTGKRICDLSSEYGIATSTIRGWIDKEKAIHTDGDQDITSSDYQTMLKKIARLEEENTILKKAMAIFAKN